MIRKNKFIALIVFCIIIIVEIIGDYYIGPNYVGNLMPIEPLSWEDIQANILSYIAFSSVLTVIVILLIKDKDGKKTNKD